ncbi:hypothetical protein PYCCODRAFT_1436916 [Trametes coccinea BRFM310]|uniref:TPX2 C-terminal domain-containing protein n=1 Tax=Trametes coccinea (strain BRFM310) TaxID=1353009 RepID=A0A1Y2ILL6_TRAC3|nr:hypothetical protein PYCCODRAFT_1436916 [Trametes coccinea BRFM310]
MGDLSLRHIPDMSDASAIADLSDASFQIPRAVGNTDDLLMADDTIDFFNSANDTLSTPVPSPKPRVLPPLTLAELTPRSKPAAAAPVPSSLLRPRPGVATPFKAVVSRELSAAISEDLSPFRHRDPSFQLPSSQAGGEDLLMSDDADDFLGQEEPSLDAVPRSAQSPLTLSQLTPGPSMHMRRVSSVSPERSPSPIPSRIPNVDRDRRTSVENVEEYSTVIHAIVPDAVSMNPTTSEPPHDSHVDQSPVARPADNGNIKEPQKTTLAAKQKKLPGGDKAKRKRVTPTAAVSKPAKLKPLTASIARRVSNAGRKPVPGVRRRPLQGANTSRCTAGTSNRRVDNIAQSTSSVIRTSVNPAQSGGLADALLSFGQKLLANAASSEHYREGSTESGTGSTSTSGASTVASAQPPKDQQSDAMLSGPLVQKPVQDSNYLTLSQLSPRKPGIDGSVPLSTTRSGLTAEEQTPAEACHQQTSGPQVSELERPTSPMRSSIKRAGSPTNEPDAHRRKRSKKTSVPSAPTSSRECAPRRPALQPSRARNASAAASAAGAVRVRRVVSASASGANLQTKATVETRKPATLTVRSVSRTASGREDGEAKRTAAPLRAARIDSDRGGQALSASGGDSSRGEPQREDSPGVEEHQQQERYDGHAIIRGASTADRPSAKLPSVKPTRPVEFQFATSTRIDSRRTDLEKSGSSSGGSNGASLRRSKAPAVHPIPDFKALHAMQESLLAQRKAEITPVVPQPIPFQTEMRAHEREKFEEARRAREAELERQREERRRQQELEEEREIKELRKRAVPKANEVPEWYAFAPKKSKAGTGK